MGLLIKVLNILLAIAVVVLCYYLIIWVLGLLGIAVPDQILKIVMVILGILAVIGALRGTFDGWWTPKV